MARLTSTNAPAVVRGTLVVLLLAGCGTGASSPGTPSASNPASASASGRSPIASSSVLPATAAPSPVPGTASPAPTPAATVATPPALTRLIDPLVICLDELALAPSPSAGSPVAGQPLANIGNGHVLVGTAVTYASCPPASGKHYSSNGLGPIAPRFYGPGDAVLPQGWIHNLEHGGVVILYNCARGGCDGRSMDSLRTLAAAFPTSPRCGLPAGVVSPVIARFDQMGTPFAVLVWDRVLLQGALDISQMLAFFTNVGETTNPEQYCSP